MQRDDPAFRRGVPRLRARLESGLLGDVLGAAALAILLIAALYLPEVLS